VPRVPEVVADASVVCKWFVPEPGSDSALRLRDAHVESRVRIIAPQLLCYEFANAIRHHPAMTRTTLRTALRYFFDLQIGLAPPSVKAMSRIAEIALPAKLTVYDACYMELAEDHSCQLVTDDSRLLRAYDRAVSTSAWVPDG
jgi:predicted nucleic acid-binding protein